MNFMLAMRAYRQSEVDEAGNEIINWNAVLEIINATFGHHQSFARSFPNGLSGTKTLREQYEERHRPHPDSPNEHISASWALEQHLSSKEGRRFILVASKAESMEKYWPCVQHLMSAERVLSREPDTSVVVCTGEKPCVWLEFNVTDDKSKRRTALYSAEYINGCDERRGDRK